MFLVINVLSLYFFMLLMEISYITVLFCVISYSMWYSSVRFDLLLFCRNMFLNILINYKCL